MKQFRKAVVVFRRDLRLKDHTALNHAARQAETILPLFIFDSRQTDPATSRYFSPRSFAFMQDALSELSREVAKAGGTMIFFEGEAHHVLDEVVRREEADAVFMNRDYTPFARARDLMIEEHVGGRVPIIMTDDYTLAPITEVLTQSGKPYSVFTPFRRRAAIHEISSPHTEPVRFATPNARYDAPLMFAERDADKNSTALRGGRSAGLRLLESLAALTTYNTSRNMLGEQGTSKLSPHIKFGTVSIREVYEVARALPPTGAAFIDELYWRDFYLHIAWHFPHVFGSSFQSWGDHVKWMNDETQFARWCAGETGVPIVDAGMRELNETGWMHNRARMITASYLTKNLLIDWRWGERYFATQLVDYDPASNNGGWQWSASVGADPRPLRIFNPYLQAREYDPEARYTHTWVPELRAVPTHLLVDGKEHDFSSHTPDYPPPLISQRESYHRAREHYTNARARRHV